MRLAATACGLGIVAVTAVAGGIIAQKTQFLRGPGAPPAAATQLAGSPAEAAKPALVINPNTGNPGAAPIVPPVPAAAPTHAGAGAAAPLPASSAKPAASTQPLTSASIEPPSPAAPPTPASPAQACPGNPNALGVARTVEIDTTGGPGFGFEHFKTHDFLRPGEVVLTFDDGPWLHNTPAVLAALAAQCTKALFFPIGLHATYYPEILRQVAAAGHTIGSHTWSHQDLSKKKGKFKVNGHSVMQDFDPKDEIEKGISAVHWAVQGPTAPFFRFPALRHPPEVVEYLGKRNIAIFSTDLDSFDFKLKKPEAVVQSVMSKLKTEGKGIVLMHDFQHSTADAMPELLRQLKVGGFKIVFIKAKDSVQTIASYDDLIRKTDELPTVSQAPTSSIVRTISE